MAEQEPALPALPDLPAPPFPFPLGFSSLKPRERGKNQNVATKACAVLLKSPRFNWTASQISALFGVDKNGKPNFAPRSINTLYARAVQRGFDPNSPTIVIKDEFVEEAKRSGRPKKHREDDGKRRRGRPKKNRDPEPQPAILDDSVEWVSEGEEPRDPVEPVEHSEHL